MKLNRSKIETRINELTGEMVAEARSLKMSKGFDAMVHGYIYEGLRAERNALKTILSCIED